MKNLKILNYFLALQLLLTLAGCQDFLEEKSVSNVTTDSYITDEAGFEDLVKACYPLTRAIVSAQNKASVVLNGTDIFTQGGWNDPAAGDPSPFELSNGRVRPFELLRDRRSPDGRAARTERGDKGDIHR